MADLDSNGTDPEIVVVTLAGYLLVVNAEGQVRPGFPIHTGIPCGQVGIHNTELIIIKYHYRPFTKYLEWKIMFVTIF